MPVHLKLTGITSYTKPATFSRTIFKGEIVANVPDEIAEDLLELGRGDINDEDNFVPFFKEVGPAALAKQQRETGVKAVVEEDDEDSDAMPAQITRRAGKDASQVTRRRKTTSTE